MEKQLIYDKLQEVLGIRVMNSLDAEYIDMWLRQYDDVYIQSVLEMIQETNKTVSIKYIDTVLYNNYKNYILFKKMLKNMNLSTNETTVELKESKEEVKEENNQADEEEIQELKSLLGG